MFNELPRNLILLSVRTSALGAGLGLLHRHRLPSPPILHKMPATCCVCVLAYIFLGRRA